MSSCWPWLRPGPQHDELDRGFFGGASEQSVPISLDSRLATPIRGPRERRHWMSLSVEKQDPQARSYGSARRWP